MISKSYSDRNISKHKIDKVVCTLGPEGTDAYALAIKLFNKVMLFESFPEAIKYALENDCFALVPCGYQKLNNDQLVDSWVNLNFRNSGIMKITDIFLSETKPMCLAINKTRYAKKGCVLHPSTIAFANQYCPDLQKFYTDSKPLVVRRCIDEKISHCIGSVDVIHSYDNFKIIAQFTPQMVWALHSKKY